MLQAYGGDLRGNVWRFDLSDPDPNHWQGKDANGEDNIVRIAKLTDAAGKAQPITTGVRIEIDQNNLSTVTFLSAPASCSGPTISRTRPSATRCM